jgi:hypothetical protein
LSELLHKPFRIFEIFLFGRPAILSRRSIVPIERRRVEDRILSQVKHGYVLREPPFSLKRLDLPVVERKQSLGSTRQFHDEYMVLFGVRPLFHVGQSYCEAHADAHAPEEKPFAQRR